MERGSEKTFLGSVARYCNEPENRFSSYHFPLKKPILIGISSDRFMYSIIKGRVRNGEPIGINAQVLSELKSKLRIPIGAHHLDAKDLSLRPDFLLDDGEKISFGNISLKSSSYARSHTRQFVLFNRKISYFGRYYLPWRPG